MVHGHAQRAGRPRRGGRTPPGPRDRAPDPDQHHAQRDRQGAGTARAGRAALRWHTRPDDEAHPPGCGAFAGVLPSRHRGPLRVRPEIRGDHLAGRRPGDVRRRCHPGGRRARGRRRRALDNASADRPQGPHRAVRRPGQLRRYHPGRRNAPERRRGRAGVLALPLRTQRLLRVARHALRRRRLVRERAPPPGRPRRTRPNCRARVANPPCPAVRRRRGAGGRPDPGRRARAGR